MNITHSRRCEHEEGEKNRGRVSRYQRVQGESDVKGDVIGGSHEDHGEGEPRADQQGWHGRRAREHTAKDVWLPFQPAEWGGGYRVLKRVATVPNDDKEEGCAI
jgi:hypothetical protein